jgi:hypothetical protein
VRFQGLCKEIRLLPAVRPKHLVKSLQLGKWCLIYDCREGPPKHFGRVTAPLKSSSLQNRGSGCNCSSVNVPNAIYRWPVLGDRRGYVTLSESVSRTGWCDAWMRFTSGIKDERRGTSDQDVRVETDCRVSEGASAGHRKHTFESTIWIQR